jgi:hypothetical protein
MTVTTTIAGGRITCRRCQAKAKHSGIQCQLPAMRSKTVCRVHGGRSTGPKTKEGRLRCAEVKTIHGRETRAIRAERHRALVELSRLEALGRALAVITGPLSRGRPPVSDRG